ncbi:unnamed protein product [Hymenolepis diminuta]|uniref:Uncharacterized protein n=1 Tax=Hymenolepis diminuta TaxID=6216 RepID=A0A564YHQ3_HYMDI|nr:unnamed protein product [Hymenolepis diminuta]
MLNTSLILLDFQLFIENHAENVIRNLARSISKDVISDLEDKIDELSQFYSDPLNWHSFDSKFDLERDITVPPNAAISGLTEAIINNYSNEFFTICDNASSTKQHIIDCTKSLEGIQQSALKRIGQRRLPEIKRNISFGRLRCWTNDMMKSKRRSNPSIPPAAAYSVAAKCARLKRRLGRLFTLAQTSHLFTERITSLEHPQIAAMQHNLMRSRLKSILNMKQNFDSATPVRLICDNPDALAKRLENLSSGLSSGIAHEAVRSRLDDLAENMTDLFMTLSQETSGLSRVLNIAEPLDHEVIKLAVRQSLDGFCNFYVTSAASKLGAEKTETLLAQLQRSEEEAEDLSQSDTEAMMDAFDVFDSFNEQSSSPIQSAMEDKEDKEETSHDASDLSHQPSTPKVSTEYIPQSEEVNSSAENDFEFSSPQIDYRPPFPGPSTPQETPPNESEDEDRTLFEGPSTPKETPPLDFNEELEFNDDNDHGREEGEVYDDDNDHHSSNDIYETEEAIMREWAPTKGNKFGIKMPYSESVQKTLSDAVKSCNRELSAVATLGVSDWESGLSKTTELQSLSSNIANRINNATTQSQKVLRREMNENMNDKLESEVVVSS